MKPKEFMMKYSRILILVLIMVFDNIIIFMPVLLCNT